MFEVFKKKAVKKDNDLAERIFEYRTYQPYVKSCPDKDVKRICMECKDIQDSLNKVIEYCEKPNTPKARYLYAITYAWSRVIYNERAIYYLEKYLSNELYLKYASNQNAKIQHLSEMYGYLIDCYVKDLKYDKALSTCDYYLENINISEISIYYKKADIFRRKNKLDIAINNFELAKKYTNNETDLEFIDRKIKDLKNKIEKKYVFKPKLKERKRIRIDSDDIFDLDI